MVAFAAGILALGVMGPHSVARPGSTAPASGLAVHSSAGASGLPGGQVAGLDGVTQFSPEPASVRTSRLVPGISTQSLAAVGTRLFFVSEGSGLQTTVIGSGSPPLTIATPPPCGAINQVSAAGNLLGYVETEPASPASRFNGCEMGPKVAWTIWLTDLAGGHRRRLATGVRTIDTADTMRYPVRLALTPTKYAFNRPNSPGLMATGETIEVHGVADGKLLWTAQSDYRVEGLMLGGPTLAVLESEPELEINVADASSPALTHVGLPASAASLSDDGQYLTWDAIPDISLGAAGQLVTAELGTGATRSMAVPSSSPTPTPLRPVVSSTPAGPIVAWYATAAGGTVYPAFLDPALKDNSVYPAARAPEWIALRGSTLILVANDDQTGDAIAYALDLSLSGFAASQ